MMYKHYFSLFLITLSFMYSCSDDEMPAPTPEPPIETPNYKVTYLESSPQRTGDATAGRDYLLYGNYVGSGLPLDAYYLAFGQNNLNELGRTGDNATINHDYTAIDAPNGVKIVSANCLQCHAQHLNGQLIVGLGNTIGDFTADRSALVPFADSYINTNYGANSPEWDAYVPFRRAILAVGSGLVTDVRGVNPADKLAALLASHRDRNDLTWFDNPTLPIPTTVVPTDVPAWWLLKKKHAMFYTAAGRGDFARFMMASSLLTLQDSTEARVVDNNFQDVLAYINSLEAPPYPEAIDNTRAAAGEAIFNEKCAYCHGTYGVNETYPNFLVDLETIGTDSILSQSNFSENVFVDWYNTSWFAQNPNRGYLQGGNGYIAPPLDGIWATAPYLHNGSVPTLEDLLNSPQRPTYWKRSFQTNDLDYTKVGWNYTVESSPVDTETYNTTLVGYGNQGHTFGDELSSEERTALIEYLKGL